MRQKHEAKLNKRTCVFIREQTGVDISDSEAEEMRRSLMQYCLILEEIERESERKDKDAH